MDRTQDSDSWGVGSIPAGCIVYFYCGGCMKDILDKVKKFYEEKVKPTLDKIKEKIKSVWEKVVPFVKEKKRYFGVAGLFVALVVVLVFFAGPEFNADRIAKENSKEVSGEDYIPDAEFEVDAYPEVNELIKEYFSAYVAADFTTLEALANPVSDMEKSYITAMSPFYEEYQNIKCYTKHGLSKDSYIVSACFDIKFKDQAVTAPSMVLFYVQTDENGALYINNLYSDFNMKYSELAINKNVYTALKKYTTQEDYLDLFNQVEGSFTKLIKENNEIYQLTKRTIPGTRQVWEDTVYYVESSEVVGSTEGTEETETATPEPAPDPEPTPEPEPTPDPEPTPEPEPQPEPEPVVQKVKIVGVSINVNIRAEANPRSNDIGDAYNGDVFVKLGEENGTDGHVWIKVQFDGDKVGYIRSDFLADVTE